MSEVPAAAMRRKICPFISFGETIVRCKGADCNACRPVPWEDKTIWVCALIDKDFGNDWEMLNGQ